MTTKELETEIGKLKKHKSLKYNLKGGCVEEGICMAEEKDFWQVYHCERGSKNIIGIFPTENDACEFMLCKLKQESDHNRWF